MAKGSSLFIFSIGWFPFQRPFTFRS